MCGSPGQKLNIIPLCNTCDGTNNDYGEKGANLNRLLVACYLVVLWAYNSIWKITSHSSHPSMNMPVWYPLWLSLKHSNSATELPSDSVAQLVRAWQAICQVTSSSHSLSHCLFSPYFLSRLYFHLSLSMTLTRFKACQVWSMLTIEPAPHASRSPPPTPQPTSLLQVVHVSCCPTPGALEIAQQQSKSSCHKTPLDGYTSHRLFRFKSELPMGFQIEPHILVGGAST